MQNRYTHPGWYVSPLHRGQLQYWNGYAFTDDYRPMPPEMSVGYQAPKPANNSFRWILRSIAAVLLVIGLIPLFITAPYISHATVGQKIETSGTVDNIRYRSSTPDRKGDESTEFTHQVCSPTVAYVVDGITYIARTNEFKAPCDYHKGDTVSIEYNESNPRVSTIKGQEGTMPGMWSFFIIGLGLTGTALILSVVSFKPKKR